MNERVAEALEALVEQVRIANVIALAGSYETMGGCARQASSALADGEPGVWGITSHLSLRPDIAAALGIEVGDA